jgi:hypothetical protein
MRLLNIANVGVKHQSINQSINQIQLKNMFVENHGLSHGIDIVQYYSH